MKAVGKRWTVTWYVLACVAAITDFALVAHLAQMDEERATEVRMRQIEQAAKQMDKLVRR